MTQESTIGSTWIIVGSTVVGIIAVTTLIKIPVSFIQKYLVLRKFARWKNTPKGVVILHCLPPDKTVPSYSPFILKVETFLRLANIPYQHDRKDPFGAKGKTPWITLNGEHVHDSDLIIRFLSKNFETNINNYCSEQQLAIAHVVQTMSAEFLFSGMALQRFVYNDFKKFQEITSVPYLVYKIIGHFVRKRQEAQGIALHSPEIVVDIMTRNLKAMSTILGGQPYFGGQHMCEADCGIFGMLAQYLWTLQGSSYENLLNGECKNLKEFCYRVKESLWPDWDEALERPKNKLKSSNTGGVVGAIDRKQK